MSGAEAAPPMPTTIPYDEIYALGSAIPLLAFQICTALLFSLAIICALSRSIMRFLTRRPLYWDDLFLAIGVACLVTATGLNYKNILYFYMLSAVTINPALYEIIPPNEIMYLLNTAYPLEDASAAIVWTTIFCVKASFLIVSKQLIARTAGMNYYFWAVAIFTGLSWATVACAPFIECPHFGTDSAKCSGPNQEILYVAMNALISTLDIGTDVLIASIPILVLWRAKIDPKQKLVIGPFLSLSLVMIIFSAIRVSRSSSASKPDVVWLAFWQYLEASIAVIVTSITTLRTVFTARRARKTQASSNNLYGSGGKIGRSNKATPNGTLDMFNDVDEDSHPMVIPLEPARIVVEESWNVSYSEPRSQSSAEDLGQHHVIGVGR